MHEMAALSGNGKWVANKGLPATIMTVMIMTMTPTIANYVGQKAAVSTSFWITN